MILPFGIVTIVHTNGKNCVFHLIILVAALRYQHLAAAHCIQGDFTKTSLLLVKASHIIDEIKDKNLHLFNDFLNSSNYIINGNFKEAIHTIEVPQDLFEKSINIINIYVGIIT